MARKRRSNMQAREKQLSTIFIFLHGNRIPDKRLYPNPANPNSAQTLTLINFGTYDTPFARLAQNMKFLDSLQPLGLLILRVALGIIFFTHGYPKLMRPNLEMQHMFVQHGLPAQFVYV